MLRCVITNIGPIDIFNNIQSNTQHLVLGVLWQIVKVFFVTFIDFVFVLSFEGISPFLNVQFGLMSKLTVQKVGIYFLASSFFSHAHVLRTSHLQHPELIRLVNPGEDLQTFLNV
jgi:hypothetical protein